MSSFSETSFMKKLTDLNNSQQSIQTLSIWLIHHRKHAKPIVQLWYKTLKTETKRKLLFFYLANDVVQNSKKKGPEYNEAFQSVLVDAYKHAVKNVDEKTVQSMSRLVNIWAERAIFSKEYIGKLKKALSKGEKKRKRAQSAESETSSKSSSTHSIKDGKDSKEQQKDDLTVETKDAAKYDPKEVKKHTNGKESKKDARDPRRQNSKEKKEHAISKRVKEDEKEPAVLPKRRKSDQEAVSLKDQIAEVLASSNREDREVPEAEDLVKAITDLEHAASFDAAVREKIAALPPEVSDATALAKISDRESAEQLKLKVNDAVAILDEYNSRLQEELDERKKMAVMLNDFVAYQKSQLTVDEERLEEIKSKLEKVTSVRKELQSHISSLPDFSLLPNFTVGLAPLPSAGDLFSSGDH